MDRFSCELRKKCQSYSWCPCGWGTRQWSSCEAPPPRSLSAPHPSGWPLCSCCCRPHTHNTGMHTASLSPCEYIINSYYGFLLIQLQHLESDTKHVSLLQLVDKTYSSTIAFEQASTDCMILLWYINYTLTNIHCPSKIKSCTLVFWLRSTFAVALLRQPYAMSQYLFPSRVLATILYWWQESQTISSVFPFNPKYFK